MKATNILLAAIAAVTVVACNQQADPSSTAPTQTTNASATLPSSNARPMGNFGMELAGPMQVSLGSDPNPLEPGKAKFTAEISKNAKPVNDAKVDIQLDMPSMKMLGKKIEMKPTSDGKYEANEDVMKSDYAAKVTIDAPEGKGTAEFKFTVN